MSNFILIGLCMTAGFLMRKYHLVPKDAYKGINTWLIYMALPAASFKYIPHIEWSTSLIFPALAPVIIWCCGWLFVTLYKRTQPQMSPATVGGLKLVAGLCNTSFVGFPLIMAYFSEQELSIAIICDQVTFLLLSTIGIIVALRTSQKQKLSTKVLFKRLATFPPLLGCIGALTIPHFIEVSPLDPLFNSLAGTIGPLALFSIGMQIKLSGWRGELQHIGVILSYKLLLAPAIILAIAYAFPLQGKIPQITSFEAAMPTLLTAGIIADQYQLNPKLSNLIVGIGILLSLITTAFWHSIIIYLL
jgi:predicted permease